MSTSDEKSEQAEQKTTIARNHRYEKKVYAELRKRLEAKIVKK